MHLREGAQRLQAARHRARKALLAAQRGEHQPVQRAVRLFRTTTTPNGSHISKSVARHWTRPATVSAAALAKKQQRSD